MTGNIRKESNAGGCVFKVTGSVEKRGCTELWDNRAKVSTRVSGMSTMSSEPSIISSSESEFCSSLSSFAHFLADIINASVMILTGVENGRGMLAWSDVSQLG